MKWKFFIDDRRWFDRFDLFIVGRPESIVGAGERHHVKPLEIVTVRDNPAGPSDLAPTIGGTEDDVRAFLQAALDAAWQMGLRPEGFADFKNELSAVRDHRDDLRKLVFKLNGIA